MCLCVCVSHKEQKENIVQIAANIMCEKYCKADDKQLYRAQGY